jgi:SAM-dependent methyltransferase
MNETHWSNFYKGAHTLEPSPFARWLNFSGFRIVDFGCGNGRDTRWFAQANSIIGVDPCAPEGELFQRCTIQDYISQNQTSNVEIVYCRFVLHAIEEDVQWLLFDWARQNGATVYAEFRSSQDVPLITDHERRLIDGNRLLAELLKREFHIEHYQEGHGLARFGSEDPHIIRLITRSR